MKEKALIAMSGGVDSSVSAAAMTEAGFECVGVNMRLCPGAEGSSQENLADAEAVCRRLGMVFHSFDFTESFRDEVIGDFIEVYERGGTPNPCICCNRTMKFGLLMQTADRLGCRYLVTGHYARVEYDTEKQRWLLKKARNASKDQSYVLYFLTQEQLSRIRFPLGDYESKEEIRAAAARLDFPTASKKESQDICFVPDGDYAGFIRSCTGKDYPAGAFTDRSGKVLGQHKGLIHYTIGQRRGLGLSLPESMYVVKKDSGSNQVILGKNEDLFSRQLIAERFIWSSMEAPEQPIRVTAKTRYQAKEAACSASVLEDGTVLVLFDEPQRALTVGQSVVLYDGDTVVGGGIIREA